MGDMIERVARAMSAACYEETGSHQFITSVWEHFAREAIEEMREPSEAMLAAMCRAEDVGTKRDEWQAGIDAALAQGGERE